MSIRLSVAILSAVLFLAEQSFAQVQTSPVAGGTGGDPFTIDCDGGRVLVGVRGRTGNYVSRIEGLCAELDEIVMPRDTNTTATAGEGGGQEFEQRCPTGWAVRGLRVRRGSYIDALKIRCGRLGRTGRVAGFRTHPIYNGGGGGQMRNLDCPDDLPGTGLRGRAEAWVDRIGLRCQAATVPTINPADPNRADLRVAIRGYPTVVNSNDQITWRVELWNIGGAAAPGATVNIVTPGAADAVFDQDPGFTFPVTCNSNAGSGRRCTAGAALPAGARMVVRVRMTPQGGGVEVESSAVADEPGQINESNETNNSAAARLQRVIG